MTNEEAINIMKAIIYMLEPEYDTDRIEDAVEMAIKALSQQTEDAISRQAAIDSLNQSINILEATDRIAELPSVTAKQKWIPASERLPENSGNYLITYCLRDEIETQEAVYVKDEEEDKWFDVTDIEITLAVIAWMPLPPSYQGE